MYGSAVAAARAPFAERVAVRAEGTAEDITVQVPRERVTRLLGEVEAGIRAMVRGEAQQAYAGDERLEAAYAKATAAVEEYQRQRMAHFQRAKALVAVLQRLASADEAHASYRTLPGVWQDAVPADTWTELMYLLSLED